MKSMWILLQNLVINYEKGTKNRSELTISVQRDAGDLSDSQRNNQLIPDGLFLHRRSSGLCNDDFLTQHCLKQNIAAILEQFRVLRIETVFHICIRQCLEVRRLFPFFVHVLIMFVQTVPTITHFARIQNFPRDIGEN